MKARKTKKINLTSNKHGTILLLSLLIVIGTLAASFSFGTLIISNIQRSKLTAFSNESYYVAESGTEVSLYEMRKLDVLVDNLHNATCTAITAIPLDNCNRQVEREEEIVFPRVEQDTSVQVDFVPRDAGVFGAEILSITIEANQEELLWIDATLFTLKNVGGSWNIDPINQGHQFVSFASVGTKIDFPGLISGESYILRIRAVGENAINVRVTAMNNENEAAEIGNVKISTIGNSNVSDQKITVIVPPYQPVSSFLDYVLFSEKTIEKIFTDPGS